MTVVGETATTSAGEWQAVQCWECGGHGVQANYDSEGFMSPSDCDACGGEGSLWVSPAGRLALWPGGPFVGSLGKDER